MHICIYHQFFRIKSMSFFMTKIRKSWLYSYCLQHVLLETVRWSPVLLFTWIVDFMPIIEYFVFSQMWEHFWYEAKFHNHKKSCMLCVCRPNMCYGSLALMKAQRFLLSLSFISRLMSTPTHQVININRARRCVSCVCLLHAHCSLYFSWD